ncbi:hypothetical protein EXN66_Car002594 [Channa argus]|uniref:Uncharacterized protein n=1 Tax=Channa argus TaxID=215402 RepID=A0A6G1P9L4_CHAAH|nr:hypothetical protein EXN66_Car002594 [Channa argus]
MFNWFPTQNVASEQTTEQQEAVTTPRAQLVVAPFVFISNTLPSNYDCWWKLLGHCVVNMIIC